MKHSERHHLGRMAPPVFENILTLNCTTEKADIKEKQHNNSSMSLNIALKSRPYWCSRLTNPSLLKTRLAHSSGSFLSRVVKAEIDETMTSHEGTTLKQNIPALEQEFPGLQKHMQPQPSSNSLETPQGPKPYVPAGKLKGKKALITGGE